MQASMINTLPGELIYRPRQFVHFSARRGVLMTDRLYKTVLADLSTSLTMQPLVFDDTGACDLVVDEEIALKVVVDHVFQRLLLIGLMDISPDLPLKRLLSGALNPLFNDGPGLGWHAGSELYIGFKAIPREKVSVVTLKQAIAELVEWIKTWRDAH
ncbi:Type III chaperone protein SchA [Pseudomonas savastanoi]|nr:Type III chaperone protein SchA [Pseudomonas savastanoi]RMT74149.1 Type III chaperone protein SchA [Pseudomonas savastanoi pv. nerii]